MNSGDRRGKFGKFRGSRGNFRGRRKYPLILQLFLKLLKFSRNNSCFRRICTNLKSSKLTYLNNSRLIWNFFAHNAKKNNEN